MSHTRHLLLVIAVGVALAIPLVATANTVSFNLDTTTGCFGPTSATSCPSSYVSSTTILGTNTNVGSLKFQGLSTSSVPANSGSLAVTLGSFTLSDGGTGPANSLSEFNGKFFAKVTFIEPATISNGNPAYYTATLDAEVRKNKGGDLSIDFDNAGHVFTFANPNFSGTFTFAVDDVTIEDWDDTGNHQKTVNWTGHITAANQTPVESPVPEPTSMLLLGTGLVGGIGALRRRRS